MPHLLLTPESKDDWGQILDRIDASITRALKETAAQEKALKIAVPKSKTPGLGLADDRTNGLRGHLDSAVEVADAVEALLAADEVEARAWVGLAERAAARLAALPTAGIR